MNALIGNDFFIFMRKQKKIIVLYCFINFFYFFSKMVSFQFVNSEDYAIVLGLKIIQDGSYISQITYFLNLLLCVYAVFKVYRQSIHCNVEFLFLRLRMWKWAIGKSCSIIFLILLVKAFIHGMVVIFFGIKQIVIPSIVLNYITDVGIISVVMLLLMIGDCLFYQKRKIFMIVFIGVLIVLNFCSIPFTVFYLRQFVFLIYLLVGILIFIYAMIFSKFYLVLFERML